MSSRDRILLAKLGLWIVLTVPVTALAGTMTAPRVPENVVQTTNQLQRAVYACELGSRTLATSPALDAGDMMLLGAIGPNAGAYQKPVLRLQGTSLVGLAVLEEDQGPWMTRVSCELTQDLAQATSFSFKKLAPISDAGTAPKVDRPQLLSEPSRAKWQIQQNETEAYLMHGVPETDDRDFYSSCDLKSGKFTWFLPYVPASFTADTQMTMTVFAKPLKAMGLYIINATYDDNSGAYLATAEIRTEDPVLDWLSEADHLTYSIGVTDVTFSLAGSAIAAKSFAQLCTD